MINRVEVSLLGRDRAVVEFHVADETPEATIERLEVEASGCTKFLERLNLLIDQIRQLPKADRRLQGSQALNDLIPKDRDHVSILIRELILKARNQFERPYKDIELCHCRGVPTDVVDRAIVSGCQTVASVARATSAGTSCGTCKPDTEAMIEFRLKSL